MRIRIFAALIIATIAWGNGYSIAESIGLDARSGIYADLGVIEVAWAIPLIPLLISLASFLWLAWAYNRKEFWEAFRFRPSPTRALL